MSYKYDIFISHASEDKDFVRPLAVSLRAQRLAVWFDEFELKPGVGLRESIDKGLLSSRFGLVVLSPAFFRKSWPRWELDGLVQLAHSRPESTIIPLWHKVGHSDVALYSPSLANIVAISTHGDIDRAVSEILSVLRPRPTAVEMARQILIEHSFPAPILSDDWWLDAAAWSAPTFGEGTFQEASSWGWWGFALPPIGDTPELKGPRIAWGAMQHSWQEAALEWKITQCSHPSRVLEFLQSQPGLQATVEMEIDYLLWYAPQLGIPGCGGFLEPLIHSVFLKAETAIKAGPARGAPGWVLHDPDLCAVHPDALVEFYFWPTDPAGTSPDASVLAWVDAAAWIASSESDWLPLHIKSRMTEGLRASLIRMPDGRVEIWDVYDSERWAHLMYSDVHTLRRAEFTHEVCTLLVERIAVSCEMLSLPEPPAELVDRIASWGVFEKYWTVESRKG